MLRFKGYDTAMHHTLKAEKNRKDEFSPRGLGGRSWGRVRICVCVCVWPIFSFRKLTAKAPEIFCLFSWCFFIFYNHHFSPPCGEDFCRFFQPQFPSKSKYLCETIGFNLKTIWICCEVEKY